jgi:hypothetical protein
MTAYSTWQENLSIEMVNGAEMQIDAIIDGCSVNLLE